MTNPQNPFDPQEPHNSDYDAYRYSNGPEQDSQANQNYQGYQDYQSYGSDSAAGATGTGWAMDAPRNGVAPWALGVSILGLVMALSVLGTAFAIVAGVIGVVLSIIAVIKARKIQGPGRRMGMSVTGLVLSIITVVLSILFWVAIFAMLSWTGIADCFTITDPAQQELCVEESLNSLNA